MAFEEEDGGPRHAVPKKPDLDVLSIEALQEYIGDLKAEIARAEAAIAAKQAHRGAAETFFKS